MPISIELGDITTKTCDAIVNAANESLLAGGGVCGAIHHAAGRELEQACRGIGFCPTGSAVVTPGFGLKARHVIHAVGPRWLDGSRDEAMLLDKCYKSIFDLVEGNGFSGVAVPAISTGIYRFPLKLATEIAVRVARQFQLVHASVDVIFVCFDVRTHETYVKALADA
jgi:O-acetyl-ADP-ribose deacetylase (regulator of RNase III)